MKEFLNIFIAVARSTRSRAAVAAPLFNTQDVWLSPLPRLLRPGESDWRVQVEAGASCYSHPAVVAVAPLLSLSLARGSRGEASPLSSAEASGCCAHGSPGSATARGVTMRCGAPPSLLSLPLPPPHARCRSDATHLASTAAHASPHTIITINHTGGGSDHLTGEPGAEA